jgi:hypothetical protein
MLLAPFDISLRDLLKQGRNAVVTVDFGLAQQAVGFL